MAQRPAHVLIVDDDPADRQRATAALETINRLRVSYAENGEEALQRIAEDAPDLIVTDLNMPVLSGLGLIDHLQRESLAIPTVLMTGHGNEELAAEALLRGATSYVPKQRLEGYLGGTVDRTLKVLHKKHHHSRLLDCLVHTESCFQLKNDESLIPPILGNVQSKLSRMDWADEMRLTQVTVALDEALSNAIFHGNLEVDSKMRSQGPDGLVHFMKTVEARRALHPYAQRQVSFTVKVDIDHTHCTVEDEGNGFDPDTLPDPTKPENLLKASGRGLMLIRSFMDEVQHHGNGNRITMIKRRPAGIANNPRPNEPRP